MTRYLHWRTWIVPAVVGAIIGLGSDHFHLSFWTTWAWTMFGFLASKLDSIVGTER